MGPDYATVKIEFLIHKEQYLLNCSVDKSTEKEDVKGDKRKQKKNYLRILYMAISAKILRSVALKMNFLLFDNEIFITR